MSNKGTELSARVIELESQLAHAQRLFEQLDAVVTQQGTEIDTLRRTIVRLENQLREMKAPSQPPADPLDETPPHY